MDAVSPRVPAVIEGGREVSLILDNAAMIEYRLVVGKDITHEIDELFRIFRAAVEAQANEDEVPQVELGRSLQILSNLLWACLLDEMPDLTIKQARKLLPHRTSPHYEPLFSAVVKAVKKGLGMNDDAPQGDTERPTVAVMQPHPARPRKPLTGTVSGRSPAGA